MTGGMVQILVGKDRKPYDVHRKLLCHRGAYFRAALDGNFLEAQSLTLDFSDESEEIFALFLLWLYNFSGDCLDLSGQRDETLFNLLVLAERLTIDELYNFAMDQLRNNQDNKAIQTPSHDQRLLVDQQAVRFAYLAPAGAKAQFLVCLTLAAGIKDQGSNFRLGEYRDLDMLLHHPPLASDVLRLLLFFREKEKDFQGLEPPNLERRLSYEKYHRLFHNHRNTPKCEPSEDMDFTGVRIEVLITQAWNTLVKDQIDPYWK